MSERSSESENPAIPSPTPKATRPRTNRDWWPDQLDLSVLHQHSPRSKEDPQMLTELPVVEQRYLAVREVLDGATPRIDVVDPDELHGGDRRRELAA